MIVAFISGCNLLAALACKYVHENAFVHLAIILSSSHVIILLLNLDACIAKRDE